MTINGLGTRSQTSLQALAAASHQPRNRTTTSGSDSLSLSSEALSALKQSLAQGQGQGDGDGGRPPMTDAMAATIGADIQSQNAELFKALDTDGTGVLTAAKLEAGKDKVDQAVKDGTLKRSEKPQGEGGQPPADASQDTTAAKPARGAGGPKGGAAKSSNSSSDSTTQQITALHNQGLSNAEIAKKLGTTLAKVQKVLSSAS